jgi:hypothetical protein
MPSSKRPEVHFQYFVTAEGVQAKALNKSRINLQGSGYTQSHRLFALNQRVKDIVDGLFQA